jgi:hypothetical protein
MKHFTRFFLQSKSSFPVKKSFFFDAVFSMALLDSFQSESLASVVIMLLK